MPPLPHIHLAPLREATGEATREILRGGSDLQEMLTAAFDVAQDVDATQEYPTAWLIFRLKLPSTSEKTMQVAGGELLADLAAMVEHLTEAARLEKKGVGDEWRTLDELAEQWNVSRKTVDRYRKRGLLAWRVRDEQGKPVLMVEPGHAAVFAGKNANLIGRAAGFERIDAITEARMLRRAAVYRERFGCTLNQTAERLAKRFGRSREAVRSILKRDEERVPQGRKGRFTEPDALSERDCGVCLRAVNRGIDPALLARRFRKPMGSIRRAIGLSQWRLVHPHLAMLVALDDGSWSDAQIDAALASPPAQTGLAVRGRTEVAEFLEDAAGVYATLAIEESTRVAAYRATRIRAARLMVKINQNFPATTELDEIITMLRWASRLKVWLMRSQFRLCMQTLEAAFATPLTGLRSGEALAISREMTGVLSDLVDQHAKGEARGRLAAPVGLALNKLAGKWVKERLHNSPGKAVVRATSRPHGVLPDWTRAVHPWQSDLEGPEWLRRAARKISPELGRLLVMRCGWDEVGSPPRTLEWCMSTLGWSRIRAVRAERLAMHEALMAVREEGSGH